MQICNAPRSHGDYRVMTHRGPDSPTPLLLMVPHPLSLPNVARLRACRCPALACCLLLLMMGSSAAAASLRLHFCDRLGEVQIKDKVAITLVGPASRHAVTFLLERDNTEEFRSVTLPAAGEYVVQLEGELTQLEKGLLTTRRGAGSERLTLEGGEVFEVVCLETNAPIRLGLRRLQFAPEVPAPDLLPLPPILEPDSLPVLPAPSHWKSSHFAAGRGRAAHFLKARAEKESSEPISTGSLRLNGAGNLANHKPAASHRIGATTPNIKFGQIEGGAGDAHFGKEGKKSCRKMQRPRP